ncbi:transcriptional regulator LsrR [Peptococcaceae bacterium CEB3]|nr:transcriptional regulator LsrR [Peptococcaceae bacterium CEB3]
MEDEKHFITKIAYAYFIGNLTQQEVAKRFHLSRPTVSRLLQKSRDEGIIEIIMHSTSRSSVEMEKRLEETFHIREAVIVPAEKDDSLDVTKVHVAEAAASTLERYLGPACVLGLFWGSTVLLMSNYLHKVPFDLTVAQLTGGINYHSVELQPSDVVRSFSQALGAKKWYVMYAPAYVETEAERNVLMDSRSVQQVIRVLEASTVSLTGIGYIYDKNNLLFNEVFTDEDMKEVKEESLVGELNGRFLFDQSGRISVTNRFYKCGIGISLERFKAIPVKLSLASGAYKAPAILGALRAGLVDVLVTDTITASAVLDLGQ